MFPKKSKISALPDDAGSIRVLLGDLARQATLLEAVDAFLRIEMLGKSDQTRKWYEGRLTTLAHNLGESRPLVDVMEADLLEWYEQLRRRNHRYVGGQARPEIDGGLSTDTLHGYIRSVKRFFRWLFRRGILPVDLAADLHLPRLPRRGKKGVSDVDAAQILEAAKENVRDYAILRFLSSTGARRGGVADLRLSDLSLDALEEKLRRRATVREKGDKERVVLMTPSALKALEAWLVVRPKVDDDHVFLGQKAGESWKPLSEAGISGLIRRYKERLGISGKVSPHQWRHRWCRKRLQEGMGLKQVSQLAGHESIVVTSMFYGDFAIDDLQDSYDRHVRESD